MIRLVAAALAAGSVLLVGAARGQLMEDLPDVVLSASIEAQATALGNDPIRIYEFVSDEVRFEHYFGLWKGPEATLHTRSGNDYDQAALLVSLLRAAGVNARFVRGLVDASNADLASWTGYADGAVAFHAFVNAQPDSWPPSPNIFGPFQLGPPSGPVTGARVRHVWVEALVPLGDYRGLPGAQGTQYWVPMFPALHPHAWTANPGLPLSTEPQLQVDFDSPTGFYQTVSRRGPLDLLRSQIKAYLATPGVNLGDIQSVRLRGDPEQSDAILLSMDGFPGRTGIEGGVVDPAQVGEPTARADSLQELHQSPLSPDDTVESGPEAYRYQQIVRICSAGASDCALLPAQDPRILAETPTLWTAGGSTRRVSIYFPLAPGSPALTDDGVEVCTGTNGSALLVNPTIAIDGVDVAQDQSASAICTDFEIGAIELSPFGDQAARTTTDATGGGVYVATFTAGGPSTQAVSQAAETLLSAQTAYPLAIEAATERPFIDHDGNGNKATSGEPYLSQDVSAREALLGTVLHLAGTRYQHRLNATRRELFSYHHHLRVSDVGAGFVSAGAQINYLFNVPVGLHATKLRIDVNTFGTIIDRDTGFIDTATLPISSTHGSFLEHDVWQELISSEAVSTVKGLQVGVEMWGKQLLAIPQRILAATAASSCTATGCTDIDLTSYCDIKQSFGSDVDPEPWQSSDWDQECPGTFVGDTTSLWILDEGDLNYQDFTGHVRARVFSEGGAVVQRMSINDANGGIVLDAQIDPLSEGYDFSAVVPEEYAYDPVWRFLTHTLSQSTTAADPVSLLNGNYYEIHRDIHLPGRGGLDLVLVRSYNSRLKYSGPIGYGWTHTFDQHLREDPTNQQVLWVTEKGSEVPWDDTGTELVAAPWSYDELARAPDGSYTLTLKSGEILAFHPPVNSIARLDHIQGRNGNRITCNYDDVQNPQRLTSVTDTASDPLVFNYDANGFVSTIVDHSGRTWTYTVDGEGDLVSFMDPVQFELEQQQPGSGRPWVYEYYSGLANPALNHNIKRVSRPEDRDLDSEGDHVLEMAYYANDSVFKQTDSLGRETYFSYDFFDKSTEVTHPDGSVERYEYDKYGNVTLFQTARGVIHELSYDEPERHLRTSETDGRGFSSTAQYDDFGNQISRTDRLGNTERWTYDGFGNVTSWQGRAGELQRWVYDARGNLVGEYALIEGREELLRRHVYDAFGNPVEIIAHDGQGNESPLTREYDADRVAVVREIDPYGNPTRFRLDALRRPFEVEHLQTLNQLSAQPVVAVVSEFTFDALDRVIRVEGPVGFISETDYDANGNVTEQRTLTTLPDGTLSPTRTDLRVEFDVMDRRIAVTNALNESRTVSYDERDRVIAESTESGRTARHFYDLDGNRVRSIDPSGAETRVFYDLNGSPARVVDALGRETLTTFDPERRPTQVLAAGRLVLDQMTYDGSGRRVTWQDANGNLNRNTYDQLGRRIAATVGEGGADEITVRFRYDHAGRIIEKIDGEGRTSKVQYDRLGRPVVITDGLDRSSYFTYDEQGNVVSSVDGNGEVIDREHDVRGLLLRESGPGVTHQFAYDTRGRLVWASAGAHVTQHRYDVLDRVVSTKDSIGGSQRFVYDKDGLLVAHSQPSDPTRGFPATSIRYWYDERGLLSALRDPVAGTWTFAHDALGRIEERSGPDGSRWGVSYTDEGFVESIELGLGTDSDSIAYSNFDGLGNPQQIVTNEGTTSIAYDVLGRVRSVGYPDASTEAFAYDKAGNRIQHTKGATTYHHVINAANELEKIQLSGADVETFDYDSMGRRIARHIVGGSTTTYDYDALGRLLDVDGGAVSWQYDHAGSRIRRTDTGSQFEYASAVEVRDGLRVRAVLGGSRLLAEIEAAPGGDVVRELYRDASGNVAGVGEHGASPGLDATPRRYEMFGAQRSGDSNAERAFSGLPYEGSSGLVWMGARHYDPATGRFLQADPLGISGAELYAYAANNPIAFTDPTGLFPGGGSLNSQSSTNAFLAASLVSAASMPSPQGEIRPRPPGQVIRFPDPSGGSRWGALIRAVGRHVPLVSAALLTGNDPYFEALYMRDSAERDRRRDLPGIVLDTGAIENFAVSSTDPVSVQQFEVISQRPRVLVPHTAFREASHRIGSHGSAAERARFLGILLLAEGVPDDPSVRFQRPPTGGMGAEDLRIFGTADKLGVPVLTTDGRFVRAAEQNIGPLVPPPFVVPPLVLEKFRSQP